MAPVHRRGGLFLTRLSEYRGAFRAFPWPEEIKGLGRIGVRHYARCEDCPKDSHPSESGTFAFYGDSPLCLKHAKERARL